MRDAGPGIVNAAARRGDAIVRYGIKGITDPQLFARTNKEWNTPDPLKVSQAIGYMQGSGWEEEVAKFVTGGVEAVNKLATKGLLENIHPQEAAKYLRGQMEETQSRAAATLMRTTYLEASREAQAFSQDENKELIRQVIRIEALDERTCIACVALHGTVVWDSQENSGELIETISEHHNGRGTTVVRVNGASWEPLETGPEWFARQPEEMQQKMFGTKIGFDEYKKGNVKVEDFIQHYDNKVFGEMTRQSSVAAALENAKKRKIVESGKFDPSTLDPEIADFIDMDASLAADIIAEDFPELLQDEKLKAWMREKIDKQGFEPQDFLLPSDGWPLGLGADRPLMDFDERDKWERTSEKWANGIGWTETERKREAKRDPDKKDVYTPGKDNQKAYRAARFYTRNGDEIVNAHLRGVKLSDEREEEMRKRYNMSNADKDKYAKDLDKSIRTYGKSGGAAPQLVWRGMEGEDIYKKFTRMNPGEVWDNPAFTSTAYSPNIAMGFGGENSNKRRKRGVLMEIIPKADNGAPLEGVTQIGGELEWLIASNAKFEFVGIDDARIGGRFGSDAQVFRFREV